MPRDVAAGKCLAVIVVVIGLSLSVSTSTLPLALIISCAVLIPPVHSTWSRSVIRSFQLEAFEYLPDVPLVWPDGDAVTIPTQRHGEVFFRSSSPITCFLISYFLDILMRNSTADRCPPTVTSSPCTVCHEMFDLDADTQGHALPLVNLRSPSRCQSLLPILCGVTRAVQAVSQQPTHVFVTWLVVHGRQFEEDFSSCRSIEIRPPQVDQCHYLSFMFARGDLR